MTRRTSFLILLAAFLQDDVAHAQTLPFRFYYQNVLIRSGASPLSPSSLSDFNRFRLESEPDFGDFTFAMAYEQLLTLRQRGFSGGTFLSAVPGGGEWLNLQQTLKENDHLLWRHRFDRLNLSWTPTNSLEVTVGRQAMSWATTLLLTPADPFAPFDPADPFREFRAGVDALRLRIYPAALSELELVVRPTETAVGKEVTVLARGLTTWRNWEVSGWGGTLYGQVAGAGGVAGSLFSVAVRGEISLREKANKVFLRSTIGADRRFSLLQRDLYLVVEYQHDPFGASSREDYASVLQSEPFLRGELQVLGRNETVVQASYQVHPLLGVAFLWLANLSDGSSLLSPSFSYSASHQATLTGGVFFGAGDDRMERSGQLPSEYGIIGATAYLSASIFF